MRINVIKSTTYKLIPHFAKQIMTSATAWMHHLSPWTMHRDVSLEHCCTACTSFRNDASCLSRQFQPELQKCSTSLRVTFSNSQNYVNYGFFNLQTKLLQLWFQSTLLPAPIHRTPSPPQFVSCLLYGCSYWSTFAFFHNISRFSS